MSGEYDQPSVGGLGGGGRSAPPPPPEPRRREPDAIRMSDITPDTKPDPALDQLTEADLPTFLRRTFPSR